MCRQSAQYNIEKEIILQINSLLVHNKTYYWVIATAGCILNCIILRVPDHSL